MSHFAVIIIGNNPEKQMVPYQENNNENCPEEYLAFNDTEDEYLKQYQEDGTTFVMMPDGRMLPPWDDEFRIPGTFGVGSDTHEVPDYLEKREIPFQEKFTTFEEFMKEWCGYEKRDPKTDRYGL